MSCQRVRAFLLTALLALVVCGPTAGAGAGSARHADLVLRARVTKVYVSRLPRSRYNWVVQTRVLKVLRGRFSARTFSFRVHSPSRSNLKVGKVITIRARRVKGGYRVDPDTRY